MRRKGISLLIVFVSVSLFLSRPLSAQSLTEVPALIIKDEVKIWASPFHLHASDAQWLVPFVAGTAAFLVSDRAVSEEVHETPGLMSPSHRLSNLGGGPALAIASTGLYGIGKLTHNARAANTGLLAGQAIIHSTLVVTAMKMAFNRERPNKTPGNGEFWDGGRSFPSGHSASTWSIATVVAHEYRDKPIIVVAAYAVASTVSLARVGGRNHYPSDVVVGAALGNLIGRFVLRHHDHN